MTIGVYTSLQSRYIFARPEIVKVVFTEIGRYEIVAPVTVQMRRSMTWTKK